MDVTPYLTFEFSVAILAGFVGAYIRGFTGFGSNLIWAPALVTVMDPVQAVAIMGIVGLIGTTQIALPVLKKVAWKEVYPIIIASWITTPFGIWVLYGLNAKNVRQIIGIFILTIAFILITGWRYRGKRTGVKGRLAQITTGGIAGWLAGIGGIGGPIPVLYFMASTDHPSIQRANNLITVSSMIPMVLIILIYNGAINEATLIQSAILFIPFSIGTWFGAYSFKRASPAMFKNAVLILLIVIGTLAIVL
jgi:uncharacterized membrane protein YfcA